MDSHGDYDVYVAIDFFKEHAIVDEVAICKVILSQGRDAVREHAWTIVLCGEDEDKNLRPIYKDVDATMKQMAVSTLSMVDWSPHYLKKVAGM